MKKERKSDLFPPIRDEQFFDDEDEAAPPKWIGIAIAVCAVIALVIAFAYDWVS